MAFASTNSCIKYAHDWQCAKINVPYWTPCFEKQPDDKCHYVDDDIIYILYSFLETSVSYTCTLLGQLSAIVIRDSDHNCHIR